MVSAHVENAISSGDLWGMNAQLRDISRRYGNLLTISVKLDWMRTQRDEGTLDPFAWMMFAENDIDSFFINIRSLFDHLAKWIRIASKGETPESFTKLRSNVAKGAYTTDSSIDERLIEIVASCAWFDELRSIRDDLTHRAANAIVFPEAQFIAIQVHKGLVEKLLVEDELLDTENSNLARFEWLAAASISRISLLRDQVATVVQEVLQVADHGDGRSLHSGLSLVRTWCDELLRVHS